MPSLAECVVPSDYSVLLQYNGVVSIPVMENDILQIQSYGVDQSQRVVLWRVTSTHYTLWSHPRVVSDQSQVVGV